MRSDARGLSEGMGEQARCLRSQAGMGEGNGASTLLHSRVSVVGRRLSGRGVFESNFEFLVLNWEKMMKLSMCQHRRLMPGAVLFVVVTPSICVAAGGNVTVSEKLVDAARTALR